MASNSLDTNIIVHYIVKDPPEQSIAVADFLGNTSDIYTVEDIAISETVYVLDTYYRMTRQAIIDSLNFFLTRYANVLDYNRKLTTEVFPFYLSHPKLSFNDCLLSCYAELHHAEPLFTFDKKLAAQAENAKLLTFKA